MIIAGFAGVGKSTFAARIENAIDMTSMPFSRILPTDGSGEPEAEKAAPWLLNDPLYPDNYVAAVLRAEGRYDYVIIPTSEWVICRPQKEYGRKIVVCCPTDECKEILSDVRDLGDVVHIPLGPAERSLPYRVGRELWEPGLSRIVAEAFIFERVSRGNHDRVNGPLGALWESVEPYAEIVDGGTQVVLCHYPILFYKNQHHGAVMLYGHVHSTNEWRLIEKWRRELRELDIPDKIINVGCMMAYMDYAPRTLAELLEADAGGTGEGKALNTGKALQTERLLLLPWLNARDNKPFLRMLREDGYFYMFCGAYGGPSP